MMKRLPKIVLVPTTTDAIAFVVSLCIHLTAAIALAFCLVMGGGQGGESLLVSLASESSTAPELTSVVIENHVELEPSTEPTEDFVPELNTSLSLDTVTPVVEERIGTIGTLQSELGSQVKLASASAGSAERIRASEASGSDKSKTRATFFGAEAYGNRFVFVIDSSGSMRGPRWDALYAELMRAIQSLSEDQEFFIISFDSIAHPMFGEPPPKGKFLHPERKSIERVSSWLRSIQLGHQTFPSGAVGIAMALKPDAVFLLSDGEINDSTVQDLRVWNRIQEEDGSVKPRFPIHTVLLHSQIGFATLELIAQENGGTFTPVSARIP
jgi:hypothetical protein